MYEIGIVSNANSRANRLGNAFEHLARVVGRHGVVTKTASLTELDGALERHQRAGIQILGIHGGDGTIHHTLTAAIRIFGPHALPRLAILRGGTMNTLARGLGIRGPDGAPGELLAQLVRCIDAGVAPPVTRRYVVKVGKRYGLFFGNGLMYNFAKAYYDRGKPQPWSGAQLLSRLVVSALIRGSLARLLMQPFNACVVADGTVWPREQFLTIAMASVPEAGYGFSMLPHAADGMDGLAITGIHTSPPGLVAELPKMYFNFPLDPARCTTAMARHLTIESRVPIGYTLDGDLYLDDACVEVSAGPRVEIVLPIRGRRTEDLRSMAV